MTEAPEGGWGLWGHAHLNEELITARRNPQSIKRLYNAFFGHKLQAKSEGFLIGPASQWIDELTQLAIEFDFTPSCSVPARRPSSI